ncbi:cytochrome P450 [Ganoderma sinense ZZ0214-1]|uniref:Cytochrome P450 n=1 Tax=Ganoderma sinense ZZ0214-1 TaxID=1077348 RepID=A0A2G8RT41_9APHY|nr:cytochrome P450 [Ganoderma sinense ZZ0214-1]
MDLVSLVTSHLTPQILLVVFLCTLVLAYLRSRVEWSARSRGSPLPPGPRPLPFVGNMFNWPKSDQPAGLRDLSIKYGDVLYLNVLGKHMIVLGSSSAILELLDKRSANTSSREQDNVLGSLLALDFNFSGMAYGTWWRRHRRAFWQEFHPAAVSAYLPAQRQGARRFLNKLLTSPSKLREHVRFTFTAAILKVLFDVDVADDGDELVEVVEAAMEWHDEVYVVGAGHSILRVFPILRYIPPWFPGATIQRRAAYWRSTVIRLKEEPFRRFKAGSFTRTMGNSGGCAVGRMISRMVRDTEKASAKEEEEIIRNVATVAIEDANAKTDLSQMFSTVQSVFIAMYLHPDVQRRAQAELDAVVGPNRLPDFRDRDRLVYVNALIREALWWQNVLPFAIPHCTVEDDEFREYFVPAGTNIFPNVWACMHDPEVYEDPDVFRPERFIRDGRLDFSTAPDPTKLIFGFGRRICPGRYFAENGLFINIASALHVFDITPPVDEKGRVISIVPQMIGGLLRYVKEVVIPQTVGAPLNLDLHARRL